jgi:heme-degrading monooxygenase HmoA
MITRIWRGRTSADKAEGYQGFLQRTAYPDYGGVEGNRGWILLRRPDGDAVELMLVSFWDSMDALRAYAGDAVERPKYYPEDRAALLELPEKAEHYEVVDANLRW